MLEITISSENHVFFCVFRSQLRSSKEHLGKKKTPTHPPLPRQKHSSTQHFFSCTTMYHLPLPCLHPVDPWFSVRLLMYTLPFLEALPRRGQGFKSGFSALPLLLARHRGVGWKCVMLTVTLTVAVVSEAYPKCNNTADYCYWEGEHRKLQP